METSPPTCSVACVREVSGKGPSFVRSLPLSAGTIVIVGVNLVIVDVHPRQQRRPRWTAHGGSYVSVSELRPLVSDALQSLWHEIQRAQLNVLVIGKYQDDVWFVVDPGGSRWGEYFSLSSVYLTVHSRHSEQHEREREFRGCHVSFRCCSAKRQIRILPNSRLSQVYMSGLHEK